MAEQIRTGLKPSTDQSSIEPAISGTPRLALVTRTGTRKVEPLDELWFGKTIRRHLMEFAEVFALIALIVGAGMAYKGRPLTAVLATVVVAGVLLVIGARAPKLLHPLWKGWMKLAMALGHVMTTVILSILWTLVLLPMAFLMRAIGKKVMDMSYRAPVESYWMTRDKKYDDFKLLERQF